MLAELFEEGIVLRSEEALIQTVDESDQSEEGSVGNCEDCGNYSGNLTLDVTGVFRCESCWTE